MGAVISECGRYRYTLTRFWGTGFTQVFCMLNPSTADAEADDPTIRRCIGFAKREGAGGLLVVNLFAHRATDPKNLPDHITAFGPDNYAALVSAGKLAASTARPIIAGWGAHQSADAGSAAAIRAFGEAGASLVALGLTKAHAPKHPLYVRSDAPLVPWATYR